MQWDVTDGYYMWLWSYNTMTPATDLGFGIQHCGWLRNPAPLGQHSIFIGCQPSVVISHPSRVSPFFMSAVIRDIIWEDPFDDSSDFLPVGHPQTHPQDQNFPSGATAPTVRGSGKLMCFRCCTQWDITWNGGERLCLDSEVQEVPNEIQSIINCHSFPFFSLYLSIYLHLQFGVLRFLKFY